MSIVATWIKITLNRDMRKETFCMWQVGPAAEQFWWKQSDPVVNKYSISVFVKLGLRKNMLRKLHWFNIDLFFNWGFSSMSTTAITLLAFTHTETSLLTHHLTLYILTRNNLWDNWGDWNVGNDFLKSFTFVSKLKQPCKLPLD